MREELNIHPAARIVIDEYFSLRLGDKKVKCPYYINAGKESAGLRALVGKGDPGEIEKEAKIWAKLKDFDFNKADESQIRKFLSNHHIGVECSGYVVHILNFWLKNTGKKPLISYLKFENNSLISKLRRLIRPVENINAQTITSEINCTKIKKINDILPGDLIRAKGLVKNSHHIIIITKIVKEDGKVIEIEYSHSTKNFGEENGVRMGIIKITDEKKKLSEQNWLEVDENGRCFTLEEFKVQESDNGVRRLRIFS